MFAGEDGDLVRAGGGVCSMADVVGGYVLGGTAYLFRLLVGAPA